MSIETPILSVSQLNRQIKGYLENEIGIVHVAGEVSNLSKPQSGHFYFTLKDANAQVRCVFFKNRHLGAISRTLADGQKVVASGRLSLYEARGDYQLIVEQLSEAGLGELYQQFEQLKNKLAAEGLFSQTRKKALPSMPRAIGIITSNTGAAIRDILSTLARRFPLATIHIYPSEVQGVTAAQQLVKALQLAYEHNCCDVLILARGGGSIEDLWAFNDELLARTIAASLIPVISGVGHETDFTIADFVADYRAETPTAAAIAATPNILEFFNFIDNAILRLTSAVARTLQNQQLRLKHATEKIASPHQAIAVHWQTTDYLERQLISNMKQILNKKRHQLHLCSSHLNARNPKVHITQTQTKIGQLNSQLVQQMTMKLHQYKYQLHNHLSTLHAVSPLATLDRGYAIASKNNKVLFSTQQVTLGDTIDVRLAQGTLACAVTAIQSAVEDNLHV